jgi:hypothetical protein
MRADEQRREHLIRRGVCRRRVEARGLHLGERSAWYASDHRGVVVELELA